MSQSPDAQSLWTKVKNEAIKRLDFNLSLADALNAVQPVTIDGHILVLGVREGEMHHGGILTTPDNRNAIERILEEQTGQQMSYQFIEGSTLKDWEYVKERQQRASAHVKASFVSRKQQTAASTTLDEFSQELHRRFSALEGRGFAQVKARWLLDVIPLIIAAEERLRSNDEQFYRQFARVIDKVSTLTDIPAVVIALEIERFKRSNVGDRATETE